MIQPIKNILFASDLSVEMKWVFQKAATLAACQSAKIIILHVMEEKSYADTQRLMALSGKLHNNVKSEKKESARKSLIGKNIEALKIRQAIGAFFGNSDTIDNASDDDSLIKKIIVSEGRSIADEITSTVIDEKCGMIVMGIKRHGLLAEAMGTHVVRKILRRSPVPVLTVPVKDDDD